MASRFRPIENENLGQRAYLALRDALMDGRFRPGERVRLRDLAEEMGISVTPVREAVLQLVNEGALHLRSARDIRVRVLSVEEYLEAVAVRKFLEGEALERFLERMQPQHLAELERIEERYQAALERGDYRTAVSLDHRFMFLIFEAAEAPIFLEILDRLWLLARPSVTLVFSEEGASQVDLGNSSLLAALRSGNATAVKEARWKSLDDSTQMIIRKLGAEETNDQSAVG